MSWKLADAKNRFSEVVRLALEDKPQEVHRRDAAVVVISKERYLELTGRRPDFKEFLLSGPSLEQVDLERSRDLPREVEL